MRRRRAFHLRNECHEAGVGGGGEKLAGWLPCCLRTKGGKWREDDGANEWRGILIIFYNAPFYNNFARPFVLSFGLLHLHLSLLHLPIPYSFCLTKLRFHSSFLDFYFYFSSQRLVVVLLFLLYRRWYKDECTTFHLMVLRFVRAPFPAPLPSCPTFPESRSRKNLFLSIQTSLPSSPPPPHHPLPLGLLLHFTCGLRKHCRGKEAGRHSSWHPPSPAAPALATLLLRHCCFG